MTTKITEQNVSNLANTGVQWQAVVVADGSTGLTAVAGRGYFINTTSATQTVTLPASPAIGDTISIVDYASTFNTNNVTVDPGSNKIEGDTTDAILNTNDQTHTLVFTDSTQGWKIVNQDTAATIQPQFTAATGGTVTTSGNFKIHSFTGDGNFVVSQVGTLGNPTQVDYLVIAGGGGGPDYYGGGGGAGGYRESHSTPVSGSYTASPIATPTGITVTATTYPITVGGGGANEPNNSNYASDGSNSVFSTITSAGGGAGGIGANCTNKPGKAGGSGGGAGTGAPANGGSPYNVAGAGNTPPVSPPQGRPGGSGNRNPATHTHGGGGGGAGQTGGDAGTHNQQGGCYGKGGDGVATAITGSSVTRAGGGGGAVNNAPGNNFSAGGAGGGGRGGNCASPASGGGTGTANTGSGGGGGSSSQDGGAGGKGIVIIRYKFQ